LCFFFFLKLRIHKNSTFEETSVGKEAAKNVAFIENIMLEDTPEVV